MYADLIQAAQEAADRRALERWPLTFSLALADAEQEARAFWQDMQDQCVRFGQTPPRQEAELVYRHAFIAAFLAAAADTLEGN